jgi:hypothetical protein
MQFLQRSPLARRADATISLFRSRNGVFKNAGRHNPDLGIMDMVT